MPRPLLAAALIATFIAGWWINGHRLSSQHADYVATQQAASAAVITRLLEQERDWQEKLSEVQSNAETETKRLAVELDAADRANDGLRETIDDLRGRHPDNPAAAAECRAAAGAVRMLTDMLAESDRLAGIYAKRADEVTIVAQSCIAAYGALRGK